MIRRIFRFGEKTGQNRCKKPKAQLLLACLLAPFASAGQSLFRLVTSLTLGLAIGGAVSTGGEVAVGLSE